MLSGRGLQVDRATHLRHCCSSLQPTQNPAAFQALLSNRQVTYCSRQKIAARDCRAGMQEAAGTRCKEVNDPLAALLPMPPCHGLWQGSEAERQRGNVTSMGRHTGTRLTWCIHCLNDCCMGCGRTGPSSQQLVCCLAEAAPCLLQEGHPFAELQQLLGVIPCANACQQLVCCCGKVGDGLVEGQALQQCDAHTRHLRRQCQADASA